jgi:hypothetical protein
VLTDSAALFQTFLLIEELLRFPQNVLQLCLMINLFLNICYQEDFINIGYKTLTIKDKKIYR